jgi:hypothetical protein
MTGINGKTVTGPGTVTLQLACGWTEPRDVLVRIGDTDEPIALTVNDRCDQTAEFTGPTVADAEWAAGEAGWEWDLPTRGIFSRIWDRCPTHARDDDEDGDYSDGCDCDSECCGGCDCG